jgi:branched-chain amino acid transport system permease protein
VGGGIALLLGSALGFVYRFSRFGLATRASAANEKGVVLLGYSPQFLAVCNWVIASVLATVTAIVVGPIGGSLTPLGLSALVVGALAAALLVPSSRSVWRWRRVRPAPCRPCSGCGREATGSPWCCGRACGDGAVHRHLRGVVQRGRSLPVRFGRGAPLPISPVPVRGFARGGVGVVLVVSLLLEDSGRMTACPSLTTPMVAATIMLSMVVITGYVGRSRFAQMSLAGIAAFLLARFTSDGSVTIGNPFLVEGPDLPWPIAGARRRRRRGGGRRDRAPLQRIRGAQLATSRSQQRSRCSRSSRTPRSPGELRPAQPTCGPPPSSASICSHRRCRSLDRPAFAVFFRRAGVVRGDGRTCRASTGCRFLAVRANERAAAAGIRVPRTKLLAFAIASGIAGIGGVMLGFKQNDVSSAGFVYQASLAYLAFAYLGGITSINGAIIGGLLAPAGLVAATSNYLLAGTDFNRYLAVIGGAGMIITAIRTRAASPHRVAVSLQRAGRWLRRASPRPPIAAPPTPPPSVVGHECSAVRAPQMGDDSPRSRAEMPGVDGAEQQLLA